MTLVRELESFTPNSSMSSWVHVEGKQIPNRRATGMLDTLKFRRVYEAPEFHSGIRSSFSESILAPKEVEEGLRFGPSASKF